MTLLDLVLLIILLMFAIAGFKRGVIKELASVIGLVIVFILSFMLKGILGDLLCTFMPFFNFGGIIKGLTALNVLMYHMIAFIILFGLFLVIYELIVGVSKIIQHLVNLTLVLIIPSKILGGIVGIIEGYIFMFAVVLLIMIPCKNEPIYNESKLVYAMQNQTPVLSDITKDFTNTVEEIYALGSSVLDKTLTTDEANLRTVDVMLKYKVADKDTIDKLVMIHKLEIPNIESVLNNY